MTGWQERFTSWKTAPPGGHPRVVDYTEEAEAAFRKFAGLGCTWYVQRTHGMLGGNQALSACRNFPLAEGIQNLPLPGKRISSNAG